MTSFNGRDAASALNILAETALHHEQEISTFGVNAENLSDGEVEWKAPYFDEFCNAGGGNAIKDMSKFLPC